MPGNYITIAKLEATQRADWRFLFVTLLTSDLLSAGSIGLSAEKQHTNQIPKPFPARRNLGPAHGGEAGSGNAGRPLDNQRSKRRRPERRAP
jgi:hypothetical protein